MEKLNNLPARDQNGPVSENRTSPLSSLPPELLSMIVQQVAATGSAQDVVSLSLVNRQFRDITHDDVVAAKAAKELDLRNDVGQKPITRIKRAATQKQRLETARWAMEQNQKSQDRQKAENDEMIRRQKAQDYETIRTAMQKRREAEASDDQVDRILARNQRGLLSTVFDMLASFLSWQHNPDDSFLRDLDKQLAAETGRRLHDKSLTEQERRHLIKVGLELKAINEVYQFDRNHPLASTVARHMTETVLRGAQLTWPKR